MVIAVLRHTSYGKIQNQGVAKRALLVGIDDIADQDT